MRTGVRQSLVPQILGDPEIGGGYESAPDEILERQGCHARKGFVKVPDNGGQRPTLRVVREGALYGSIALAVETGRKLSPVLQPARLAKMSVTRVAYLCSEDFPN